MRRDEDAARFERGMTPASMVARKARRASYAGAVTIRKYECNDSAQKTNDA
jgi:hypothetical protein